MSSYYNAQICLNGHVVTSYGETDEMTEIYCSKCGSEVINQCPKCHSKIRGKDTDAYNYLVTYHKPYYCPDCGCAYPWTERALQSATLLIEECSNIDEDLKSSAIESLPDIIIETPATNVAAIRIKKIMSSIGTFSADAIRQFIIDFGCELAKKSLGL